MSVVIGAYEDAASARETNTMPQWAGSCWYYLRFIDPKNTAQLVDPVKERYWMPVDLYIGGAEHAVLHWSVVAGARRRWRANRALTWRGVRCAEIRKRALCEPSGSRGAAERGRRAPSALGNDH